MIWHVRKESIGSHEVSDLIWRAHCYEQDPPDFNWLIWIQPKHNHSQMIYQVDTLRHRGTMMRYNENLKKMFQKKCSTRYITRYTEGATGNEGKRRWDKTMTYSKNWRFIQCFSGAISQTLSRAFGRLSFDLSAQISKKIWEPKMRQTSEEGLERKEMRVASMERFYGQKQAANG